jgi:hypothetical protein
MVSQPSDQLRVEPRLRRPQVRELFIAVVGDDPQSEQIYTIPGPNGILLPLVAMDERSLAVLKNYAQQVANNSGRIVRIISFTKRTLHDTVHPVTTGDK